MTLIIVHISVFFPLVDLLKGLHYLLSPCYLSLYLSSFYPFETQQSTKYKIQDEGTLEMCMA